MARCSGKGFEECDSCINREHDTSQCETCEDGSNFEPDEGAWEDANDFEEMDLSEFAERYAEELA